MEIKRTSTAVWSGTGKEGKGSLTSQSGVLSETQYGFQSRFAEGIGTNPEELIAAAHAGCFTMKLAFNLQGAGFVAEELKTHCTIALENGKISASRLSLSAKIPHISAEQFEDLVADAKVNCPVSKLLNCDISITFELMS